MRNEAEKYGMSAVLPYHLYKVLSTLGMVSCVNWQMKKIEKILKIFQRTERTEDSAENEWQLTAKREEELVRICQN